MKVAIYTRVSKDDGSQDDSRQINELREFCLEKKWTVVFEVSEDISGRKKKREGTEKLIRLAKANQIQKVLVHEISRLGRNAYDVLRTVEALFEAKCSVFDFRQHQETMDRYYQKTTYATIVLPVLAGMAEEWLRIHSFRIKSGLKQAKLKGKVLGRPKSDSIKNEGKVLPLLKQGLSYRKIAKQLGMSKDTINKISKKHQLV